MPMGSQPCIGIVQLRSLEWSGVPSATVPASATAKETDVILMQIGSRHLFGQDELRRFPTLLILSISLIALSAFWSRLKPLRVRFVPHRFWPYFLYLRLANGEFS